VVNSVNIVTVGPAAQLEAEVNYHTELQLLPILVDGRRTIAADRLGQALNSAELLALGLDPAQRYEYKVLDLDTVAIGVTTGNIVELVPGAFGKGVANQAYIYSPPTGGADSILALESENFLESTRWKPISATHQHTASTSGMVVKTGETVRTAASTH
jgi:hypothetical protein